MTEHDTALLGAGPGPEGRVGGRGPALKPGWPVSQPGLLQLPDPSHPAAPPTPGPPLPGGATPGPPGFCPSDLEEVVGDQGCPLGLQMGKARPRELE